jgi:hypothetical protein
MAGQVPRISEGKSSFPKEGLTVVTVVAAVI